MRLLSLFSATLIVLTLATGAQAALTPSGPIVISGQNGTVITGLKITSTSGPCVTIDSSANVTIEKSEIGPCGGQGVSISGSTGVNVFDSYIHVENLASGCCDTHDNVLIKGSTYVAIQGNVIAYGESNVEIQNNGLVGSDHISIMGNFLLNPRGPFPRGQQVQSYGRIVHPSTNPNTNIIVSNNYALSSLTGYLYPENQADAINFGFTNGISATGNYVVGGHSGSGCGVVADEAANSAQFLSNILSNTGSCGIGIAGGTNQVVSGNKALTLASVTGNTGNIGLYVWNQYTTSPCGPVSLSSNVVDAKKSGGTDNAYWNGGGCSTVTSSGDMFGPTAYAALYPIASTNPPPAIPPQPKNCVVSSPYTTNSGTPCSGDPTPPVVSSISPSSGPTSGGTTVTISGSGFTGASAAEFGTVAATFSVVSDTSIVATVPPEVVGVVDVTVSDAVGTSAISPADKFTYVVSSTVVSSTPPVTGVTVACSSAPSLTWKGLTTDAGYDVIRNGVVIGKTTSRVTDYTDSTAAPSTSYDYQVDAFDATGNHSAPSSGVTIRTCGP